ncbi:Na+/H+ antiporter NhaA [Pseudomonas sp. DC3000-4b1]|uniref:Na+/H+ antiporter NhaA n=1 Tax=unclassified Pseudomonas TaxID=196821 RepID=UPI003CF661CD
MPSESRPVSKSIPLPQVLTSRALAALERFSHIEAVSGIVLVVAAVAALIWANGSSAHGYETFWHTHLTLTLGEWSLGESLHFLVNDGLMTIFFLVVGMEIRQEIHDGALSNLKLATLPIGAAMGGVLVPAGLYLALNGGQPTAHGWAVPTATDIAFAVGVLALLGRSLPNNIRVFLLALAIIDDIVAILIIAVFYTTSLDYAGLGIAAAGLVGVLALQRMGIGLAWVYLVPGTLTWYGLFKLGVHPTLAGVVLGLMTPVRPLPARQSPLDMLTAAFHELTRQVQEQPKQAAAPLKQLLQAQRQVLPPVQRVQQRLHPWVAYGIMPLFALANAGVNLQGVNVTAPAAFNVMVGVGLALVVGKPLGVLLASFALVRLKLCELPSGVTWAGVALVGLLAGIGFTMAIFIAGLAFSDPAMLGAAKLSVLCASSVSAVLGLAYGLWMFKRRARTLS